jgi:hypothetical protein
MAVDLGGVIVSLMPSGLGRKSLGYSSSSMIATLNLA